MKFTSIGINNFLTIGEAKISLADRGLVLIQGQNDDDTSAKSNGAGKSSIVDALCWALYGVTARDVSGDEVVNDTAGKGTSVQVVLDDDAGGRYTISRYRKHKVGKNRLEVLFAENTAVTPRDISKGTDKETQLLLDTVIGCPLEVFVASIYMGQEQMPNLPGMTDKQLKLLIEEAAGTQVLAAAYAESLRRNLIWKQGKELAEGMHRTAVANEAGAQLNLDAALKEGSDFEDARKPEAKRCLDTHKDLLSKAREFDAHVVKAGAPAVRAELATLDMTLAGYATDKHAVDGLGALADAYLASLNNAKTRLKIMTNTVTSRVAAIGGLNATVGKECIECGKPHTEADMAAIKKAQLAALAIERKNMDDATATLAPLQTAHDEGVARHKAAQATLTDVSAVAARAVVLRDALTAIAVIERSAATARVDAGHWKDKAREALVRTNPYTASCARLSLAQDALKLAVVDKAAASTSLDGKLALAEAAIKVFGPTGVRAHVLDTVTPFLNDRTRNYLTTLSDGNIGAVWTTLSETAKGELREKFTIEVTNDKGAKSFKGLSGGEKRKVRLGCAMALQDLVASRAVKPINLFLADEIDDALDDAGLERLMAVLDEKAKERGTVLVISHNSLTDWIDNVITVTKTAGLATVDGDI